MNRPERGAVSVGWSAAASGVQTWSFCQGLRIERRPSPSSRSLSRSRSSYSLPLYCFPHFSQHARPLVARSARITSSSLALRFTRTTMRLRPSAGPNQVIRSSLRWSKPALHVLHRRQEPGSLCPGVYGTGDGLQRDQPGPRDHRRRKQHSPYGRGFHVCLSERPIVGLAPKLNPGALMQYGVPDPGADGVH